MSIISLVPENFKTHILTYRNIEGNVEAKYYTKSEAVKIQEYLTNSKDALIKLDEDKFINRYSIIMLDRRKEKSIKAQYSEYFGRIKIEREDRECIENKEKNKKLNKYLEENKDSEEIINLTNKAEKFYSEKSIWGEFTPALKNYIKKIYVKVKLEKLYPDLVN